LLEINATAVAVILNFIILMYVLNYFLYGPVRKILGDRKIYVEKEISDAEEKNRSAEAYLEQSRASIEKGNTEAAEVLEKAREAAERLKKDELAGTAREIEELKKRAEGEIDQFKAEAKKQMMDETARLSVMIAEKLIRKKLDHKSQKALIDDYINSMEN